MHKIQELGAEQRVKLRLTRTWEIVMSARFITGAAIGLAFAGFATAASAQSYTAPAGIPAVVAPGGVEGRAALPNLYDAQRRGDRAPVIVDDGFYTGSVRGARIGQGGYNR